MKEILLKVVFLILFILFFSSFFSISWTQAQNTSGRCPQPIYPFCIGSVESYYDENGCLKYACNQTFCLFGCRKWCPEVSKQVPRCRPGIGQKEILDEKRGCVRLVVCDEGKEDDAKESLPQCPQAPPPKTCLSGYSVQPIKDSNNCITGYECVANPTQWTPRCPQPSQAAFNYDINKNGYIDSNEFNIAIADHTKQNTNPVYNLSALEYENIRQLYELKCKFDNPTQRSPGQNYGQPDNSQREKSEVCKKYYTSSAKEYDKNQNGKLEANEFLIAFRERNNLTYYYGYLKPKLSSITLKKMRIMMRLGCPV